MPRVNLYTAASSFTGRCSCGEGLIVTVKDRVGKFKILDYSETEIFVTLCNNFVMVLSSCNYFLFQFIVLGLDFSSL